MFVQSHVRAHVELMWLLSSATPVGWLNKMIQFKEKSRKTVRFWLHESSNIVFFDLLLADPNLIEIGISNAHFNMPIDKV